MSAADRPTGEELVAELRLAAKAAGVPIKRFADPLAPGGAWAFIQQVERAQHPLPATVERVRALIEGRPIPPREAPIFKGARLDIHRDQGDPRQPGDVIEALRSLTERGRLERRPGETLAAAIARLDPSTTGARA